MPRKKKVPNLAEIHVIITPERNFRFDFHSPDLSGATEEVATILFSLSNGALYQQILQNLHAQTDDATYKAILTKWIEMDKQVIAATEKLRKATDAPYVDPMAVFQSIAEGE